MSNQTTTVFVFTIDNTIDLITNSSSELFVLKGETKKIVEEMIEEVYPDYRNEYEEVKNIRDISIGDFHMYLSYAVDHNDEKIRKRFNIPGEEFYENWQGLYDRFSKANYSIKKSALETIRNSMDSDIYILFSSDENPDWEKQQDLMDIGNRYHLG